MITRRRALLALLAVTVAVAVAGFYYYRSPAPPDPPNINLDGVEPAIVHVIQKAQTAVRDKPRSAATWGRLGLVLRAHAFNDESNVCFAEAERLDSNDPRWPYLQGLASYPADTALAPIEHAVELCDRSAPDITAPRLLLAEALLARGRLADAESHLAKVRQRTPDDVRLNFDLALLAFARDDNEGCIRHLTAVSSSPFARKKVAAQLAMVYARQDDDRTAAELNRRARDLPLDLPWQDPYAGQYLELNVGRQDRFAHAEELEQSGRAGEGLKLLNELLEDFPDDWSRVALGITLVRAGDNEAAVGVLRDAVHQAPTKMQAHYFLSLALLRQADALREQGGDRATMRAKYQDAAEAARQAVGLKPDHGLSHLVRGLALRRLDEPTAALESLRRAVQCRPDMMDTHYYLGETLADNGLDLEALGELGVAVGLKKGESKAAEKAQTLYARVLLRAFVPLFP